jgi:two-component system phosphate regulon sensor histidine kinase PhoR
MNGKYRARWILGGLAIGLVLVAFAVVWAGLSDYLERSALVVLVFVLSASAYAIANSRKAGFLTEVITEITRLGEFDFRQRFFAPNQLDSTESNLMESLNKVAQSLDIKISRLSRQKTEQDAVLTSMVEGVIALDSEGKILRLNQAACDLMRVDASAYVGRVAEEVVRSAQLQKFIHDATCAPGGIEAELTLYDDEERIIRAYGRALRNREAGPSGVLVVLNDVTRLRFLERIRSDFVANVSHELRTPITSIKGFVETLLDGAVDNPGDAKRFLGIIARQADRLNAIFDDLLSLSRIEQEKEALALEPGSLRSVVRSAIQMLESRAKAKGITIASDISDDVYVMMNAGLLEQAVSNLLVNAIQYSQAGRMVDVRVQTAGQEIMISVVDQGCGIEPSQLPRIFERFYRVDRGRARPVDEVGGTGLGLSIVKHIAEAHGGYAEAQSTVGQGSTFSIHLPCSGQSIYAQ